MLWAAPTERSFKSKAATDIVTAIWGAAVVVIITDGVEAEGIITAGGIIATDFDLKEAAAVGGLFHVSLGLLDALTPAIPFVAHVRSIKIPAQNMPMP